MEGRMGMFGGNDKLLPWSLRHSLPLLKSVRSRCNNGMNLRMIFVAQMVCCHHLFERGHETPLWVGKEAHDRVFNRS